MNVDDLVTDESTTSEPQFDVFLSLAILWDSGEGTPSWCFHTTGPLINLNQDTDPPCELPFKKAPLDQDKVNPLRKWNEVPHGHGDYPSYLGSLGGNRSLRIEREEFMLSKAENRALRESDEKQAYYGEEGLPGDPKAVEFQGNGMPYMGQIFTLAVILFWPKQNRERVAAQVTGDTGSNDFEFGDGDY